MNYFLSDSGTITIFTNVWFPFSHLNVSASATYIGMMDSVREFSHSHLKDLGKEVYTSVKNNERSTTANKKNKDSENREIVIGKRYKIPQ